MKFLQCKDQNVEVLVRPKKLSDDKAKSIDVIIHALKFIEKDNKVYDIILYLEPPLL